MTSGSDSLVSQADSLTGDDVLAIDTWLSDKGLGKQYEIAYEPSTGEVHFVRMKDGRARPVAEC